MSDLIRIEYRDKNGDLYESRSRSVVPRAGDNVQLHSGIYPINSVTWVEESGLLVVIEIGNKTKKIPYKPENYGNW